MLNVFMSNVYAYKATAENYLRASGLNYTIVRPGGLKLSYEEEEPTNYTLGQGDRQSGVITRPTVARLTVDSLLSEDIRNKVTFECFSTSQQLKEAYPPSNDHLAVLREDTEADIVNASHSQVAAIFKFAIVGGIIFGLAKLASHFKQEL